MHVDASLLRTVTDAINRGFALVQELSTEFQLAIVVPFRRILQVGNNFGAKAKCVRHLLLVRSRSRTSSQVSTSSEFAS